MARIEWAVGHSFSLSIDREAIEFSLCHPHQTITWQCCKKQNSFIVVINPCITVELIDMVIVSYFLEGCHDFLVSFPSSPKISANRMLLLFLTSLVHLDSTVLHVVFLMLDLLFLPPSDIPLSPEMPSPYFSFFFLKRHLQFTYQYYSPTIWCYKLCHWWWQCQNGWIGFLCEVTFNASLA